MDKVEKVNDWGWLPSAMPGVARLVAAKRREIGAAHVSLCWTRGVVDREPGWFFAREGALAVGTPWPAIADVVGWNMTPKQAMVFMRPVELDAAAAAATPTPAATPAAAEVVHGA